MDRTNDILDAAGEATNSIITAMVARGAPLHLILIGLHAEIAVKLAECFGNETAGAMFATTAVRMQTMPRTAKDEIDLAATHAGGQA